MDKSPEVIRLEMEQTRSAMQNKLETLEEQVKNTVQEATDTVNAVTESVTNVKESVEQTVANVTGTVEQTVAAVTGTVENTMTSVKQTLDLPHQVRQHPWAMFAGAAALGFVAGKLLEGPRYMPAAVPLAGSPPTDRGRTKHGNGHAGNGVKTPAKPKSSWWDAIAAHYGKDLDKLKGLAIATVGSVVKEVAISSAAPALADRIKDVVDGFTEKLGAEPIEGSILNLEKRSPAAEKDIPKSVRRNVSMGN